MILKKMNMNIFKLEFTWIIRIFAIIRTICSIFSVLVDIFRIIFITNTFNMTVGLYLRINVWIISLRNDVFLNIPIIIFIFLF